MDASGATGSSQGLEGQLKTARRNVLILSGAQAILGSVAPLTISIGSLAGYQLLSLDKSLATLPVTGFNAGTLFGAVLIAICARLLGRPQAFMLGAVIGAMGGALATIALFRGDFWLFAAALTLIGTCSGFTQKIRFAAADASPSFFKAKAISWILGAGVISAVIGPQLAIWAKDLFEPFTFAGTFLAIVPLAILSIGILFFLKLPAPKATLDHAEPARPLRQIVATPRFMTGMICGIGTYSLMSFVMIGAPLAMVIGCGFPTEMATLGIQWHVLAMFAPSFFTGMLITRFGAEKLVVAGLFILMACAVIAHMGIELWNFWGALVLLGVGWNFGFIGATAIVASSYRPAEADKVQGFHDIILFACVAISSFSSGKVFTAYGWSVMNLVIWPVAIVCLLLVLNLLRLQRRQPAA